MKSLQTQAIENIQAGDLTALRMLIKSLFGDEWVQGALIIGDEEILFMGSNDEEAEDFDLYCQYWKVDDTTWKFEDDPIHWGIEHRIGIFISEYFPEVTSVDYTGDLVILIKTETTTAKHYESTL